MKDCNWFWKWTGYRTGCLLDYPHLKEHKMTAIDLDKQRKRYADLKTIQQINFTRDLDRATNTAMFFFLEELKETILYFSHGTVRVL